MSLSYLLLCQRQFIVATGTSLLITTICALVSAIPSDCELQIVPVFCSLAKIDTFADRRDLQQAAVLSDLLLLREP